MPPKRKFAEDDSTEATRSNRSSARLKATAKDESKGTFSNKTTAKKGGSSKHQTEDHADVIEQQPTKKAKTTRKTGKKGKQETINSSANDDDHKVKQSKSSSVTHVAPSPANVKLAEPPEVPSAVPPKEEPYTAKRALAVFETYADPDEPNVIGPEGFERLCTDANLSMEGSVPLILAWQMDAKEMAKISKEEWISGTKALRISSPQLLRIALTDLEDLLPYGKPPITTSQVDPYDRTRYRSYAADSKDAFQKLYTYCFMLVKPPSSKNIEMETAVAFWSVLLTPKYPLMRDVLDFINEKGTFRAANKDLWNMMLEFCETVNPNLDNFEADGAWPTLLDEFASWKKAKSET